MLLKISMEASPLDYSDNARSVEITKTPETFQLNDELREHLFTVLRVFFEEHALRNFLGMDVEEKEEEAVSCAERKRGDLPVCINGSTYYVQYHKKVSELCVAHTRTVIPIKVNGQLYKLLAHIEDK